MADRALRPLGASGLEVSRLSLGSWKTFERLSRDDGLAVMRAARQVGINFLDDARYDDETGTAPIPSGYSEVVFGDLFRAAGWPRHETVVANKLWWEFWPEESAAQELEGSLRRMGFDSIDLIYANPPPTGLSVATLVDEVTGLVASGKARTWGLVNWTAEQTLEASTIAAGRGLVGPVAAQLPYSVAQRGVVEDPGMVAALADAGTSVVASYVLAGGVLTGKYGSNPTAGRAAGTLDTPRVRAALAVVAQLAAVAAALDVTPAAAAVAFTLANPLVCSALIGATHPGQVTENARALSWLDALSDQQRIELRALGTRPA